METNKCRCIGLMSTDVLDTSFCPLHASTANAMETNDRVDILLKRFDKWYRQQCDAGKVTSHFRVMTWFKKAITTHEREVISNLPDWYKNSTREETIDWVKRLPWWRRLFNKFEV